MNSFANKVYVHVRMEKYGNELKIGGYPRTYGSQDVCFLVYKIQPWLKNDLLVLLVSNWLSRLLSYLFLSSTLLKDEGSYNCIYNIIKGKIGF